MLVPWPPGIYPGHWPTRTAAVLRRCRHGFCQTYYTSTCFTTIKQRKKLIFVELDNEIHVFGK